MAKNNGNNSKDSLKIAALVLAVVILIAYVLISIWRVTWNPAEWVSKSTTEIMQPGDTGNKPNTPDKPNSGDNKPDTPDKPNEPSDTEAENDELLIEERESNGISLMSMPIAHSADYISTQRVTVTVLPDYATEDFTTSMHWQDSSNVWVVNGDNNTSRKVEDYVDYTETGNPSEIDINMKARFNERIICRFALESNPDIFVEIILGCYGSLTNAHIYTINRDFLYAPYDGDDVRLNTLITSEINQNTNITETVADWDVSNTTAVVYFAYNLADGTHSPIKFDTTASWSVVLSDELIAAMKDEGIYNISNSNIKESTGLKWSALFEQGNVFYSKVADYPGGLEHLNMPNYSKLIKCLKKCKTDMYIKARVVSVTTGSSYYLGFPINIADSALVIAGENITTNTNEIIL